MLYLLSVWLHILAACVWVGGLAFFILVGAPLARSHQQDQARELLHAMGTRFRPVGWVSLSVLVVTGLINLYAGGQGLDWNTRFGQLLALKLVVFVIIVLCGVFHEVLARRASELADGNSASEQATRLLVTARWLGRTSAVLALVVVFLAVALVRGLPAG